MIALVAILCAAFLGLSALFSVGETALLTLPHPELKRLALRSRLLESPIRTWLTKPQKFLIVILIGNTLADIPFASGLTWIALHTLDAWPRGLAEGTAWISGALLTTLLGEIIPKLFGRRHPVLMSRLSLPAFSLSSRLLKPFLAVFEKALSLFLPARAGALDRALHFSADELLNVLVDSGRGLETSAECLEMMRRTLEIHKRLARDIMTSLERIDHIDWNRARERGADPIDLFIEKGRTRVPVLREGSFAGYLYSKDILEAGLRSSGRETSPEKLIRPLPSVPADRPVAELLADFESRRIQMALVKNENGAPIGLITIEDILEEITGEILEEHEARGPGDPGGPVG